MNIINATAEGLGLTKHDYQPQQVQKVDVDGNPLYINPDGNETTNPTSTVNNDPIMLAVEVGPPDPPEDPWVDYMAIPPQSPSPQKVDADGNPLYIDPDGNETTNPTSTVNNDPAMETMDDAPY